MDVTPLLNNKTILITGGTGSFGSAFVKRILNDYKVKKLVIFSRDEFKQFHMQKAIGNEDRVRFFLGDIRDQSRLERAFSGIDIVIHAAALKQIPILEYNPFEAVKTNILGTQNIIEAAINQGVKKVVLISSDKAVSPVNLYGATKLCAEKIIVAANSYAPKQTLFSAVRYGNVVGSRGSIIEVLRNQRNNGKVTLTDERMTRFWLTLDRGINTVLQALTLMRGGEIFIPKIPSMRITDLIAVLAPGCKVETIGIRPGEKLHESLMTEDESLHSKEFDDFYVIQPKFQWWSNEHLVGGISVKRPFNYSSESNKKWLKPKDLAAMVQEI